ncbi:unnamed protein product [Sympodiomycopsis kandeliae]
MATSKDRQYSILSSRLTALSHNVTDLHGHVELAIEQANKTRVLASNQAALFMAANAQELERPQVQEQQQQYQQQQQGNGEE